MNHVLKLHQIELDGKRYAVKPAYHKGNIDRTETRIYEVTHNRYIGIVTDSDLITKILEIFEPPIKPMVRRTA